MDGLFSKSLRGDYCWTLGLAPMDIYAPRLLYNLGEDPYRGGVIGNPLITKSRVGPTLPRWFSNDTATGTRQ
jgi:hypothetical protein